MMLVLIGILIALVACIGVEWKLRKDAEAKAELAREQAVDRIRAADMAAEHLREKEIQQHAVEAQKALEPDLDSAAPFDEAAAKELVAGAGVEVK